MRIESCLGPGALALAVGCLLLACGDDDATGEEPEGNPRGAVQALARGVSFDGAEEHSGGLPETTAPRARLLPPETVSLAPGEGSLLSFDVDDPDEADDPIAGVLLQFEDADSFSQVPVEESVDGPA